MYTCVAKHYKKTVEASITVEVQGTVRLTLRREGSTLIFRQTIFSEPTQNFVRYGIMAGFAIRYLIRYQHL